MAGKESLGISHEMSNHQELSESTIPQSALHENETAQAPEMQGIIRQDEILIIDNPFAVHTRFLLGPSNSGKSVLGSHMLRVQENDPDFLEALQKATHNPQRRFEGFHLSLSQTLSVIAEKYGVSNKRDLTEEQRAECSQIMLRAVALMNRAFENDEMITAEFMIDTVGITEQDLGKTAIAALAQSDTTRFFLPEQTAHAENKGRKIRNTLAENPYNPDVDTLLAKEGIVTDVEFQGDATPLIASSGNEAAWRRHWEDIYQQVKKNIGIVNSHNLRSLSLDDWMENQPLRHSVYRDFVYDRMEELGAPFETDEKGIIKPRSKTILLPNNENLDTIHYPWGRMYGQTSDQDARDHQFPLELLLEDRPVEEYTKEEIRQVMGI